MNLMKDRNGWKEHGWMSYDGSLVEIECPDCEAEIFLPEWMQDWRPAYCPSCGKRRIEDEDNSQ